MVTKVFQTYNTLIISSKNLSLIFVFLNNCLTFLLLIFDFLFFISKRVRIINSIWYFQRLVIHTFDVLSLCIFFSLLLMFFEIFLESLFAILLDTISLSSLHCVILIDEKKICVALTQLSLTLHCSRRIFYYQHYFHI